MPQPDSAPIRVKFLTAGPEALWRHQFPHGEPTWGRCRFSFDHELQDYDWLVVYDDVPAKVGESKAERFEHHPGYQRRSVLVTTEPSSIKFYGHAFTRQFGCVLTSQDAVSLPHPGRLFSQPALQWFYGVSEERWLPFDDMLSDPPEQKTKDVSIVYSPKAMRLTLHRRRQEFMQRLIALLPDMAVFGREAMPLDDKAEALDDFRYHVAIENHIGQHHWTEKLADAFLGLTLPFYDGCPNAGDYFPEDSFIRVDMRDPEGAARTIRQAIANNEYEKRLPAIREARRRVLFEYNLFAVLSREIELRHEDFATGPNAQNICSRHALRKGSALVALSDFLGKARMQFKNLVAR